MTANPKTLRYALTGALAGVLLAGTAYAGNPVEASARNAEKAQAALVKGQAGKAVGYAEDAVAGNPHDVALRALLGQTYLRAGRFESAATTLDEARQLGDASSRTALSLALAKIGQGQARDAVALLDTSREQIGADDLGLAYALAGETGRGVAILSDAMRAGEPSSKLRQNLAYAFALDGRWREARVMMSQDVPADQIDDRVSEWASRATPEAYRTRVAAILGAPVVADAGRPDRLALVAPAAAEQVAVADAPVAEPVAAAPAAELPAVAASDIPPSLVLTAPETAPPAEPAPENFANAFPAPTMTSRALVQTIPVKSAAPVRSAQIAVRPVRVAARWAAAPATGGTHLVQLGSFSSEANAKRAWGIFTARNASLRNYRLTITPVVVRGKNFWRVAAAGFNAGGASSMCGTVKARGGACFAYAAGRPMPSDGVRFADAGGSLRARR
jgi:Flp pilus assembly protein TadD